MVNSIEPYRRLLDAYQTGDAGEGDFSERLLSLSKDLVAKFQKEFGAAREQRLTAQQVTELIYKHNIRDIRHALSEYLKLKQCGSYSTTSIEGGLRTGCQTTIF